MLSRRPIRRRAVDPVAAAALGGLPPILARLFAARGLRHADELDTALAGMAPVSSLGGVEVAAELVASHLERGSRILVVGDFDADGATSTALLCRALGALGGAPQYLVPDRFVHGYGLTPALVRDAAGREPALLVTVDSGINCHAGVTLARELGMDVLVTDHHLPGARLPPATAIVNPVLPGQSFPSRCLAGVGVAFYLVAALARRLGHAPGLAAGLLDLVALGTVADLVPLDRNNRILVEHGLRRIRAGASRPGIEALLRSGQRDPRAAVTTDLAFAAGPRLNAAGRLDDMSVGIECLLTDDAARAAELAALLSSLNEERKSIEARMQQEALRAVAALEPAGGTLPAVLCVHQGGWHGGVVGLVASRIKDALDRSAVVVGMGGAGSCRAVDGFDIGAAVIAAKEAGILIKGGGHTAAAGLTVDPERIGELAAFMAERAKGFVPPPVEIDLAFECGRLDPAAVHVLEALEPYGMKNPKPRIVVHGGWARQVNVMKERHVKVILCGPAGETEAIMWNAIGTPLGDALAESEDRWVDVYGTAKVDEYGGRRRATLMVEDAILGASLASAAA